MCPDAGTDAAQQLEDALDAIGPDGKTAAELAAMSKDVKVRSGRAMGEFDEIARHLLRVA